MGESWKSVVGWEGIYEVSDLGRVRRIKAYFKTKPVPQILKPTSAGNGYFILQLCRDGERRSCTVHRLVAAAFIGPCPSGKEVNHKDRDRSNNHLDNLEYTTHPENVDHSYTFAERRARVARGMDHVSRILTEEEVLTIRAQLADGATLRALAGAYNVGLVTIFDIKHRKTWAHI